MLEKIFNPLMMPLLMIGMATGISNSVAATQSQRHCCSNSLVSSNLSYIGEAKLIQLVSYNEGNEEKEMKYETGDSAINGLLTNVASDKYGLNPKLDIFLRDVPATVETFEANFDIFDKTIRGNMSTCSKKTYKNLDAWLKKEAQVTNTTAESASIEYEGYGDLVVTAIETYFTHANKRVMMLIEYIDNNKPLESGANYATCNIS